VKRLRKVKSFQFPLESGGARGDMSLTQYNINVGILKALTELALTISW